MGHGGWRAAWGRLAERWNVALWPAVLAAIAALVMCFLAWNGFFSYLKTAD